MSDDARRARRRLVRLIFVALAVALAAVILSGTLGS